MSRDTAGPPLRLRILIAAVLALCGLGLTATDYLTTEGGSRDTAQNRAAEAGIAASVDTMFVRYGIAMSDLKTWRATAGGRPTGRIEQRVSVGPRFLSVEFNHELNLRLGPLGAHVVATEKTRDNIVTMHIVRDGTTVRSIAFVTDPGR